MVIRVRSMVVKTGEGVGFERSGSVSGPGSHVGVGSRVKVRSWSQVLLVGSWELGLG